MGQQIIRIDLDGVNCYLGKNGDNFILFDTGGHLFMDKQFTNRREKLQKELEKAGCKQGNLKLVLLTHGDNDHVANAAFIRDNYKVKIAMHQDDLKLVENPVIENVMENCRYKSVLLKIIFVFVKKLINRISVKILDDFERFKPDIYVNDGYDLNEYGFDAKIIHIPGHTNGSIGVLTVNREFVAGDVFANTKKPEIAPNACDFKALALSVKRVEINHITTVYPGHGEPFEAKLLKKN